MQFWQNEADVDLKKEEAGFPTEGIVALNNNKVKPLDRKDDIYDAELITGFDKRQA